MSYNLVKSIVVLLAFITAGGIFGWRAYKLLWVNLRRGQPTPPFRHWGERTKGLFVFVGAQLRLFRFLIPGTAHFFIFWGFLFLSLTILQAIIEAQDREIGQASGRPRPDIQSVARASAK
jgi:hypothetical protein